MTKPFFHGAGPSSGVVVGRIFKIPICITPSLALFTAILALFSSDNLAVYGLAIGSVFLHELGHVRVARRLGVPTLYIQLNAFGGLAVMNIPRDPHLELLIAVAGPLVSLGLSLTLLIAYSMSAWPIAALAGKINLGIGVYNLIPCFPMDGGRILRALWSRRRGVEQATKAAVRLGRVLLVLLVPLAVLVGAWPVLAAVVPLWLMGSSELREVSRETGASLKMSTPKTTEAVPIGDIRRLFETSSDANVARDCVRRENKP